MPTTVTSVLEQSGFYNKWVVINEGKIKQEKEIKTKVWRFSISGVVTKSMFLKTRMPPLKSVRVSPKRPSTVAMSRM